MTKQDEIWKTIEKCFDVQDTIWYSDAMPLYDKIVFVLANEEY